MFGTKVKINRELYKKAKDFSAQAGYSSVDEFVEHCIDKELQKGGQEEDQEKITNRLKGLGYIS